MKKELEITEISIPAEDLKSPTFCSKQIINPQTVRFTGRSWDELLEAVKPMVLSKVMQELVDWERDFLKIPYVTSAGFVHDIRVEWEDNTRQAIRCAGSTRVITVCGLAVRENEPFGIFIRHCE